MTADRLHSIARHYASLRIAVVGDFCLDRYLEIDPAHRETSIETGLPVHNVVAVRAQPGGAGTILNNLAALGIGAIYPVGFCGEDGEGFELRRALAARPGVRLDYLLETGQRRTFTYCKPLMMGPNQPPRELNRLDSKNWTPTPVEVRDEIMASLRALAPNVDAMIALDQVDVAGTGVITPRVLDTIGSLAAARPRLLIITDSRRGLRGWPPVMFKMNAAELAALTGSAPMTDFGQIERTAANLAQKNGRAVVVTMAERGMMGASPDGTVEHVQALPLRGPIDIVGAGDSVTANLASALAAGATLREALELAITASSIVIHQLGTTGTASVAEMAGLLGQRK